MKQSGASFWHYSMLCVLHEVIYVCISVIYFGSVYSFSIMTRGVASVVWAWNNEAMVRSLYGVAADCVMAKAMREGRVERRSNCQGELVWWYYIIVAGAV